MIAHTSSWLEGAPVEVPILEELARLGSCAEAGCFGVLDVDTSNDSLCFGVALGCAGFPGAKPKRVQALAACGRTR